MPRAADMLADDGALDRADGNSYPAGRRRWMRLTGISHGCCAWSQTRRADPNGAAHAAEAYALPFRAGRDRPRPAGCPPTYNRITLSDREAPGEPAPGV